ncbi:MAG: VOC family protein [Alphaproteobacteria bacterium]|jgi:hypothetical protein|nr:VOC family protein [Alphaproteobacteria bacterium]
MANGIVGIDHGVVAVRDLAAAHVAYRRLGFTLTPRRSFEGWGTANYSAMMAHHFIELLGIVDADKYATPGLEEFLQRREGLMAVALLSRDIDAAHAEMKQNGLDPSDLNELEITLEMPDAPVQQRFRWLILPPQATPELYVFVVQPLTPESMRQPSFLVHDNSAKGIDNIAVVVGVEPATLRPAYETLFGAGACTSTDDALKVATGQGDLVFLTPKGFASRYPDASATAIADLPDIAAMRIAVEDLDRLCRHFDRAGVAYARSGDGVSVAADEACGVLLEFAP